jgi:hypothetical protein
MFIFFVVVVEGPAGKARKKKGYLAEEVIEQLEH